MVLPTKKDEKLWDAGEARPYRPRNGGVSHQTPTNFMEARMDQRRSVRFTPAIFFILFTILVNGCVGGQALQQEVTTEYLLSASGFQKWQVNDQTPKRQALLEALPSGQISTYIRDGQTYHAYPDNLSRIIYVGDAAAYQKYQSLSQGRKMCRRVTGANQVHFWSCMEDFQQSGARPGGK